MTANWDKILAVLKETPKTLAGVALGFGILLFAPDKILSYIFLDSSLVGYRNMAGMIFVLSISALAVNLIVAIWNHLTTIVAKF